MVSYNSEEKSNSCFWFLSRHREHKQSTAKFYLAMDQYESLNLQSTKETEPDTDII